MRETQPDIISLKEARKILRADSLTVSDAELARIIQQYESIATELLELVPKMTDLYTN
jgi:hypothetical protein